ncbi:unnamed protein product [Spodoptera littoralis]|uniref:Ankyrin repeat, SAM and basic leucine zipper domain-containing protein 1 n=1 Tax=Spodoptera littoralis TaxID=7109 RepID=A0A9P0HVD3_SPOLI|nr:unnamed protein product [Spodoptera littoralis]CAH1635197.1 unnamed protein product [Spodoptera littoralis]
MTHTAGRPGGESDSDPDDYYGYFDEPPRNYFQYQQENDKKKLEMDLQDSIINGSLAEVQEIVATRLNNNVNTRLDSGWNALMHACFHAQDAIVKYLLEEGADPNFRAEELQNKLYGQLWTNSTHEGYWLRQVDVVQKFLDLGVNIEVRDLQGWTALFWAAHHNQPQILEILIARGARMSEVDKYNRTALELAELHDYNEIVEILKRHLQIPEDHEESYDMEITTWHDFYPGIKKGQSPDYRSEIPHLLYGMHLENFTSTIMKSGMDLRTFLLLEENDMVKLGMDLPYERQRLKSGLRHFHKRNWKLKAVSGLALQPTDNFSMLNYLTSLGSHLHQIYVLEATLQYTLREYNKIQDQIKFEPPESPIREKMVTAAKNMLSNVDCIKRASARVQIVLEKIAENNPEPADLIKEKTMRDIVLGYFTEAVVVASLGMIVYQARSYFSQFIRK